MNCILTSTLQKKLLQKDKKKTENIMEKMSKNQKGKFIYGNINIKSTYKDVRPD